jgi:hypothetical protein
VSHSPLTRLLAAALPTAVVAAWLGVMLQPVPRGQLDGSVAEFERRMSTDPDVVVLGNSLARSAVDLPLLAETYGLDDADVASLVLDGSHGALWYAVVKHRIVEAGHTPDLLIVPTVPTFALMVDSAVPRVRAALADHLPADDDAVLPRTLGEGWSPWWWQRIDRNREAARTAFLDLPRRAGGADADAALASVFDADGAVDMDLHASAMPIVQIEAAQARSEPDSFARSFMPDLLELTAEAGIRVLFVQVPVQASWRRAQPAPEETAALVGAFNDADHAGFLDLSGLVLPPSAFADASHLSRRGKELLMAALLDELTPGMVDGSVPLPVALPPVLPTRVARTGEVALPSFGAHEPAERDCCWTASVPELAGLGDARLRLLGVGASSPLRVQAGGRVLPSGVNAAAREACTPSSNHFSAKWVVCGVEDGTVVVDPAVPASSASEGKPQWWVPPGTALEIALPDERGELEVAWVRVLGDDGGTVTLGEAEVVRNTEGLVERAKAQLSGPATLRLEAGTGWQLLRAVVLRQDGAVRPVIGKVSALASPPRLLTEGKLQVGAGTVEGPGHVVSLEGVEEVSPGLLRLASETLGSLSDEAMFGFAKGAKSCNTLVARLDGEPMPGRNLAVGRLRKGEVGYTLDAGGAWVRLPDGRAGTEGLELALRWTPGECRGWAWVHPGQTWVTAIPRADDLLAGVASLELLGGVHGDIAGPGRVELRANGRTFLQQKLPLAGLAEGLVRIPLKAPVPPSPRDLELRVSLPVGGASIHLASADLRPAPPWTATAPGAGAAGDLDLVDLGRSSVGDFSHWPQTGLAVRGKDPLPTLADGVVTVGEPTLAQVCAPRRDAADSARFVVDGTWQGEGKVPFVWVSWYDDAGPLQVDGKAARTLVPLEAGAFRRNRPLTPPDGATRVSACVRFPKSTGTLTLTRVGWGRP